MGTEDVRSVGLHRSLWRSLERLVSGSDGGSRLARGAGTMLGVHGLGTGIAFGLQVLLVRLLGSESYGNYVLPLAWTNLLSLVGKLGLDTASLRFLPAYEAREEWALARGFLRRTGQLTLLSSLGLSGLMGAVVWLLGDRIRPELTLAFWTGCLLLPATVLFQIRLARLQAAHRAVLARTLQLVVLPAVFASVVVAAFLVFDRTGSASTALALQCAATATLLVLAEMLVRKTLPVELGTHEPAFRTREWTAVGGPLLLVNAFNQILLRADLIMVGFFLGPTMTGVYAVVTRLAELIAFAFQAVNSIAAPQLARLHAKGDRGALQRLTTLAAVGILLGALPLGLLVIAGGKLFLGVFGEGFLPGYGALVLLAAGRLFNSLAGPVGSLLMMTGHHVPAARIIAVTAFLNVLLNLLLIPRFGIEGAAVATVATTGLWNVLACTYAKKKLAIDATPLMALLSRRRTAS